MPTPTLAEQLAEAEKQYQQAVAQAGYCQGRVETLRQVMATASATPPLPTRVHRKRQAAVVDTLPNGDDRRDPLDP